jgi:repressor LexA
MSIKDFRKTLQKEIDDSAISSIRELGRQADIDHSYISRILNGKTKNPPSPQIIKKLEQALNIADGILMIKAGYISGKVNELKETKSKYNYDDIIKKEVESIPVIGTISAGQPVLAEQNILFYKKVPADRVSNGQYFFLKVKGDSMINAGINEGDLVLIRRQSTVENNEIAVVMVNSDEATLKRVIKTNGSWVLQPENPNYENIIIKNDQARIIGKAIEVMHKL